MHVTRVGARLDRGRGGRFLLDTIRGALTVLHHVRSEPVFERAAALSYGTILALVPLLSVSLAVADGVGHDMLRLQVRDFAFAFLATGIRSSSMEVLEGLIDHATSGGVVSISGAALFISAIMMLRSVEAALNSIWGVRQRRTFYLRFIIYLVILAVGPVLLGLSLAMTAQLRALLTTEGFALTKALFAVGPFVFTVLGLGILYKLGPNAQVRKRAAFAGALVSGMLFEIAKHGYATYTAHAVAYSLIYGSLAAIPLFLVWLYLSWIMVLFGARLAYAVQNAGSWGLAVLPRSEWMRARLAARTLLAAAVAQAAGRRGPSIHAVARSCGVNEAAIAESALLLKQAGLLAEDPHGGLVPARPLEAIRLDEVSRAAAFGPEDPAVLGSDPASRAIASLFAEAQAAGHTSLARLDLRALAEPLLIDAASPTPPRQP
jgi:membrane protein